MTIVDLEALIFTYYPKLKEISHNDNQLHSLLMGYVYGVISLAETLRIGTPAERHELISSAEKLFREDRLHSLS